MSNACQTELLCSKMVFLDKLWKLSNTGTPLMCKIDQIQRRFVLDSRNYLAMLIKLYDDMLFAAE